LRGKNFAVLLGYLLKALLQPLPPPLAAFGRHFTFEVGQSR
jgi:hypothetical protein